MFDLIRTILIIIIGSTIAVGGVFSTTAEKAAAPSEKPASQIGRLEIGISSPASTTPKIKKPAVPAIAAAPATSTKPALQTQPKLPILDTPIPSLVPAQTQVTTSDTPLSPQVLNDGVRSTVVNIICASQTSGPFNSISASGVIIDPRGVVMTNAHVGQYFLLKDYPKPDFIQCIIRTGSPAQPKYTAELLFLPPSWIAANAKKINVEKPTGTGEHDYALLRITGTVSSHVTLPSMFSYLSLSPESPVEGEQSLVAGYPAGFLGGITIATELYQASSVSLVGQFYTFGTNTVDLFSVGGTIVAQQGSSGGAVANQNGILTGLIVTSSQAPDTGSRDLRAVATSYIMRDFENESGKTFSSFISGDLAVEAQDFAQNTLPAERQALIQAASGQ